MYIILLTLLLKCEWKMFNYLLNYSVSMLVWLSRWLRSCAYIKASIMAWYVIVYVFVTRIHYHDYAAIYISRCPYFVISGLAQLHIKHSHSQWWLERWNVMFDFEVKYLGLIPTMWPLGILFTVPRGHNLQWLLNMKSLTDHRFQLSPV